MIRVAGIANDSIVDGPGIRVTVFGQGCPHHCKGCHNPETWAFEGGTMMSAEELFAQIQRNPLAKGVTFSGGEPFAQAAGFAQLATLLKDAGYEVASYTGYTLEQLLAMAETDPDIRALLSSLDVLIDGPFVLAQRSLSLLFRGSQNQRILNVPQSLAQGTAVWCTAPRWVGENAPAHP